MRFYVCLSWLALNQDLRPRHPSQSQQDKMANEKSIRNFVRNLYFKGNFIEESAHIQALEPTNLPRTKLDH